MKRAVCTGIILLIRTLSTGREIPDVVAGNLQQFNENGAWSLYQDQRVVIDTVNQKLITGSIACGLGVGGMERAGNIETVRCDLATGFVDWFSLREGNPDTLRCDNRYAPSFLVRRDGRYLAMYSPSFNAVGSNYRIFSGNFWQDWDEENLFNWAAANGGNTNFTTAASNLVYCSSERRLYNFVRGPNRTFHCMVSQESDSAWSYGGQCMTADSHGGIQEDFCQYSGNGFDRIDIIMTEHGTAETPGGIFHGYIKNGALHNSSGAVIDESIFDTLNVASPEHLTKVFPDGSLFKNDAVEIAWSTDVQYYPDDTIVTVVTARIPGSQGTEGASDYRIVYCLFDGNAWRTSLVAKAGLKPSLSFEGHFGQTALDPDDKNIVYLSSTFDPRNDVSLGVHELFKGTTGDHGQTWNWVPITSRSNRDNLSPVVPVWNEHRTALLWMRGTCISAHHYDASIVGIIDREGEALGKKHYLDAGRQNCFNACCFDSLEFTYVEESHGGDNRWHQSTGSGNSGTVIVSSETPEWEDAMLIKQVVEIKEPGIYDFWANFWGKPDTISNWLISTGLQPTVQLFRQMACRTVDTNEYDSPPLVNIGDTLFLYQAYAGRDTVDSGEVVCVFIDDHVLGYEQLFGNEGDAYRTWFDGISYARIVTPARVRGDKTVTHRSDVFLKLHQIPARSLLKVTYSVDRNENATIALFDLRGRLIQTHTSFARHQGTHTETFSTGHLRAGVYLCRLTAGNCFATAAVRVLH
ncbi:MAG: T9SS type A sorting domain-containing protein [Chitinispirillaceae bacterium]|nr:T9SS type A sorting domain-containing protein [Chitinispirillaceae bacterium]